MKRLLMISAALAVALSCDETIEPLSPAPDEVMPEITASFDSLSTYRAYVTIDVGKDVKANRYCFNWTQSSENKSFLPSADMLTCLYTDTAIALMSGDSLDIVPQQTFRLSIPCLGPGTWENEFSLTTSEDTLHFSLSYINKPEYNYALEDIYELRRYSAADWERDCDHVDYFPVSFDQDSTFILGTQVTYVAMPDVYKPANYISDYEFSITAGDGIECKFENSSFGYTHPVTEEYIKVDNYGLKPIHSGPGTLIIKKGPYEYTKDYYVYDPIYLEGIITDNYYISFSLLTAGIKSGVIGLSYVTKMKLIRNSDDKVLWEQNTFPTTLSINIKNEWINYYDKIINFSDEYDLLQRKMYELSADRAEMEFVFTAQVPHEYALLRGKTLIGKRSYGDTSFRFDESDFMEVIYDE